MVGGRTRTGNPVAVVERVDTHYCRGVMVDHQPHRQDDAAAVVVAGRRVVVVGAHPSRTAANANRDSRRRRHNNPAAEEEVGVADTDRPNRYYQTNCVLPRALVIVPTIRPDCRNQNTVVVAFLRYSGDCTRTGHHLVMVVDDDETGVVDHHCCCCWDTGSAHWSV